MEEAGEGVEFEFYDKYERCFSSCVSFITQEGVRDGPALTGREKKGGGGR